MATGLPFGGTIFGGEWRAADPLVLLGGMLLGTFCALGTYRLGALLHDRIDRGPGRAPEQPDSA